MNRLLLILLLIVPGIHAQSQILPEFWISTTSDTVMMIEPRGESSTKAQIYIYIVGAPLEGNEKQIRWFRAYMDSTKNKKLSGYDLLPADTIKKYHFTAKGELLPPGNDSVDIHYVVYDTQEMQKGQDSGIHIFAVTYQLEINVGRKTVIETRGHHYEFMGNSADEAYEKPLFTLHGWSFRGTNRQVWMLGCIDLYQDVPRNSVLNYPVNYFGFR